MSDIDPTHPDEAASWRPLGRLERRVLGVLVEKAKTTPDNYPLTLASLVAGCNQKSNRSPQMQVDEDDVTDALVSLRAVGAVREVQGSGRVNKYRHAAYEWLQVNGAQAAVMSELLLRGPQTAGELRSRAGRMEPFPDLESLVGTLDDLQRKGLVVPLTPPGRGQVFAHALYQPDELRRLQQEMGGAQAPQVDSGEKGADTTRKVEAEHPTAAPPQASSAAGETETVHKLRQEVDQLRERVERLERQISIQDA